MKLDPVLASALRKKEDLAASRDANVPSRGDASGLRSFLNAGFPTAYSQVGVSPDVTYESYEATAEDGARIPLRWYTRATDSPGSAVVYVHGGGMIAGTTEFYDPIVRHYVQSTGVPFLSVEYRLAPDVTGDASARDVMAALEWLILHAAALNIDPQRIAIMGDSGGGGIGAGAAILARDRRITIAAQILIFPMLDDRNTEPDPHIAPLLLERSMWTYEKNHTCWSAVLGEKLGTDDVSPYAAPARLEDFGGLPAAYIEVGTLDIFRDESILYALNLLRAGVQTELHVHPGAPHGHDWLAPTSPLAERWKADRARVIAGL
ncbi:alpha/beta hydrolase [Agromyces sp. NPDC049794]|uniref:alpha/beta hydrolase n=1 Tax=unclassified Agromyces TaxID=2639701 RepID=UPI00340B5EE0